MRIIQIRYRLFYLLRKEYRKKIKFQYEYFKSSKSITLNFEPAFFVKDSFLRKDQKYLFDFLNLSYTFKDGIDWNFNQYGKLWTYNLNYFDYLLQENIDIDDGIALIHNYIDAITDSKDGLEPFPIALRGMNWIKFLAFYKIKEQKIDDSLYAQYDILMDNLEYHLLGNHLLENGFSLLFGGYYFADKRLYSKAKEILQEELEEQILSDGAHFELTPMYHQLMLYRLLDCINLVMHNSHFTDLSFQNFLVEKAALMHGWLANMMYHNGTTPHFNDSTDDIAPTSEQLLYYSQKLKIAVKREPLGESGYRKYENDFYECFVDVGNIGSDYIPGHAHSDTFNFELHIQGKAVVVDTGISTYETNQRRKIERSTIAHNTVMVNHMEQSQVWSSFRVAERAKIISLEVSPNRIVAIHDGYREFGVLHKREFHFNDMEIKVIDTLLCDKNVSHTGVAYFHFSSETEIENYSENKIVTKNAIFSFEGLKKLEVVDITLAKGFNKLLKSKMAKVTFDKELCTLVNIVV